MNGRLSDTWLDELRSRVRLEEVVSEVRSAETEGKNVLGLLSVSQ